MRSIIFLSFFLLTFDSICQFSEKSQIMGIEHLHRNALLLGGGATFFDYNSDGFIDLYVTGGGESDKLYHNANGQKFVDFSLQSKVWNHTKSKMTSGIVSGDVNNDGCKDLFITTSDDSANMLLINNCDGTFSNESFSYGIIETSRSMGATFLDVNNDGFLDLYVINYIQNSEFTYNESNDVIGYAHECYPNFLYISNGEGAFTEQAEEYNVNNNGCSLAVASTDIDGDGYLDLYLANDYGEWVEPNAAYINNYPAKGFTDVSELYNMDLELYGMGIAVGDYDNNGKQDYYVTSIGKNSLLKKSFSNDFTDLSESAKVDNETTVSGHNVSSWGTFFFDFDNDMDQDLFVSNGFIGTAPFLNTAREDPNKLFRNNGPGPFEDVTENMSMGSNFFNRGAIYGDYDNDGDLDVFCATVDGVLESDQHALLYENQLVSNNNWVHFLLEGTQVNRDAYGAEVQVYLGEEMISKEIYGSGSYASQNSNIVHFGLSRISSIDSVKVIWNANHSQIFRDPPVKQKIYLKQSQSDFEICGCMEENNSYYNEHATYNIGCYDESIFGCLDTTASNYDPTSLIDDGSCFYDTVTEIRKKTWSNIKVFPNHFEDKLNLTLNELEGLFDILLLDINGSPVVELNGIKTSTLEIETKGLCSGVYLLRVVDHLNNKILGTRKVMKK